ncbi:MAG: hypothetical protein IKN67_00785 [Alphaproteobacteria bacterium]|nr:hypothetical protein [Alphaproteobacteria bacterium]
MSTNFFDDLLGSRVHSGGSKADNGNVELSAEQSHDALAQAAAIDSLFILKGDSL